MKLTPRSQGYRFTHRFWKPTEFVDIRQVAREIIRGFNQEGHVWEQERDDMDSGWIKLGSTRKMREQAAAEKKTKTNSTD